MHQSIPTTHIDVKAPGLKSGEVRVELVRQANRLPDAAAVVVRHPG
jgi:hypothetical protein